MYRVKRKVDIAALKENADDDEIMDMIQVFSEPFFRNVWMYTTDNQISRSTNPNFICHMTRKNKLTVIPGEFKLPKSQL